MYRRNIMSEFLKNMNLKLKLIVGFSIVVFFLVVMGLVGWFQIRSLYNLVEVLGKESIPSLSYIQTMKGTQVELKAAIRTAINPYASKDEVQKQIENIEKATKDYDVAIEKYDKIPHTNEEDKLYKEFLNKYQYLKASNDKIINEIKKIPAIQNQLQKEYLCEQISSIVLAGEAKKAFDDSQAAIQKLLDYTNDYRGTVVVDKAISNGQMANVVIIILTLAFSVIAMAVAYFFANMISKPVIAISDELAISANNLEKAGNQVASASQELSSGASELASSVEEITSSMEELQSIVEANTKNVNEAEILMKETVNTAKASQAESEELLKLMMEVQETSKKVVRINKVIDDIAFQTNILALNAAVEAARAGDVGRGFAVVAEQVKSLAQKSAESSKETSDLIDTIAESITKSKDKTEITVTAFKEAVARAEKVNVLLDEITRASKEQAKGANQVTKAISQVNSVVQELAASSEETASSSEEMLGQVESMREGVIGLNTVTKGEREAKRIEEEGKANAAKQDIGGITQKAHKVHEAIDAIKDKTKTKKESDVEIVKPEDKIPLNDFKDF